MTRSKIDKSGINDIKKRLEKAAEIISRKNGTRVDLKKERIFTKGPFLHQNTSETNEEESAQFERDNPELFGYLRALDDQLGDLF